MRHPLSIALLGTRGIPANYGGFETFAEELSTRLVLRGHRVTVFCREFSGRTSEKPDSYRGVSLKYARTVARKYLETPLHALTSNVKLPFAGYDAALLCNAANSPFAWMIRACGLPLAINVDGIERERAKWNALGRLWYRLGEWCSVQFADAVVGDARVICDYYRERYGVEAVMIPYGASAVHIPAGDTLSKFGLESGNYILYVSRLEPENNALGVIEAFKLSGLRIPLVIVGDAPYADRYKERLRAAAKDDPLVRFTGFQFGDVYREFQSNCMIYIQATEVGGTHPALVEAMAYGNCVIANGTAENKEVLGDAGEFYERNDFNQLADVMRMLASDRERRSIHRERARKRALERFSWDAVTSSYEELLYEISDRRKRV